MVFKLILFHTHFRYIFSVVSSLDEMKSSLEKKIEESTPSLPRLSDQLLLDELWDILGCCLTELSKTPDHHAVLILQPAVEAFFIVHSGKLIFCGYQNDCSKPDSSWLEQTNVYLFTFSIL